MHHEPLPDGVIAELVEATVGFDPSGMNTPLSVREAARAGVWSGDAEKLRRALDAMAALPGALDRHGAPYGPSGQYRVSLRSWSDSDPDQTRLMPHLEWVPEDPEAFTKAWRARLD